MELVTIRGLNVKYGNNIVLHNVDLDIYSGDFMGVIGPNGGGKTTLVKAMLKALPYSGAITYSAELEDNGHRRIGYLPQVSDIDKVFPLSVREIVLSGLQSQKGLFGKYTAADKEKADKLLELCSIRDIAKRTFGEISGGQAQRTLLCRALISDPKLLILDEPANFVDNKFEKELYELLGQLNERMAIIMVSHDLGTISSHVKSIVCVNKHVHRHDSNIITAEQLENYNCPIKVISHGEVPHTVLENH